MCFLRFSKQKGVDDSGLYYFIDKGSIKLTRKLEALDRTQFIRSNRLNFDKICILRISEFLQSSFIFVIYLMKEVYRKIMSKIHFVGKSQYEDLTETGCYLLCKP